MAPRPGLLPPTKQKVQINPRLSLRLDEKRRSRQWTCGLAQATGGYQCLVPSAAVELAPSASRYHLPWNEPINLAPTAMQKPGGAMW
jgi:hypothetical protein